MEPIKDTLARPPVSKPDWQSGQPDHPDKKSPQRQSIIFEILLLIVLLAGAYLRLVGWNWGEYTYLHPDERFLVMVGSDITPIVKTTPVEASDGSMVMEKEWISLGEYFNTAVSPLNPHNRGHGFYVYGTLPMFLTRYVVEWIYGHSGLQEMTDVGRPLSALADLLTVFLVYLTASRLYNKRVGLLAAAFSALAVLQIQQSHFFTMDTFINLFSFLSFYFAVRVALGNANGAPPAAPSQFAAPEVGQAVSLSSQQPAAPEGLPPEGASKPAYAKLLRQLAGDPLFRLSLYFGIALGMAVASKLNALPMAIALPAAMLISFSRVAKAQREAWLLRAFAYLVMAGIVSVVIFRIFQPYAFSGPGFFGVKLNPLWVENIRSASAQASGDVDMPPNMQWARRPIWYALQHMSLWGMGLPLGILAWVGFLYAGWRMLKGDWQRHALVWGWTALYFIWQSTKFNPTMRYMLPIYPTLAIFAAWFVVQLYDAGRNGIHVRGVRPAVVRGLAALLGAIVLLSTAAYAYGFSQIYVRPITRVEASRWIYQNIPGPLNIQIQTPTGPHNQILSLPYDYTIRADQPYFASFVAKESGLVDSLYVGHILDKTLSSGLVNLSLVVSNLPNGQSPLGSAVVSISEDLQGQAYILSVEPAIPIFQESQVYLTISDPLGFRRMDLCGELTLYLIAMPSGSAASDLLLQNLPAPETCIIQPGMPFSTSFIASGSGLLSEIYLARVAHQPVEPGLKTLSLEISTNSPDIVPALASVTSEFAPGENPGQGALGNGYQIDLQPALQVEKDQTYHITIQLTEGKGEIAIQGSAIANEGDWDDGLPLRLDGYDGFGGIYTPGLNFNMYWDDNLDKLSRFERILDEAEYILISSNRQWGSLTRLPERFPMTTVYYRNLLGCPLEEEIVHCYQIAKPGMFTGQLGFELVKTFQSDAAIGPLAINDQSSDEAFTVYDHPKVFVFKKTAAYDSHAVHHLLESVDLTQVVRVVPGKAGAFPANLLLPEDRLQEQYQGGTWSELFNTQAWQNRFQILGVILWYLVLFLLGLFVYPILRLALPGLPDQGYPLARTAGLLLLSYFVWLAGSYRIPFNSLTIGVVFLLLALVGISLGATQREALRQEWQSKRRYYLLVEGLFLAFFVAFLLIRLGNPDLWHPWKGGEKPMDFSYFNAILKSTTFPPYDPWFQGGYLNYYYFGWVYGGVLVKFLGIVPAIGYNLVIPTLFSLTALGAFSIAYNLVRKAQIDSWKQKETLNGVEANGDSNRFPLQIPFLAGLGGAVAMVVLGNLGTLKMIFRGYQILMDPSLREEGAGLLVRWSAAIQGLGKVLSGERLPYPIGDWYWNPSRVMPPGDNAITEFPLFTYLFGDLHAHMFALPLALLALAWGVGILLGKGRWARPSHAVLSLMLGGLAIGALWTTNTWDFPVYLAVGVIALLYVFLVHYPVSWQTFRHSRLLEPLADLPDLSKRLLVTGTAILALAAFSLLFFQPYAQWYGQGYTAIEAWQGPITPMSSYLTHWALFLFVLASWMLWESVDWMANTPLSALRKLEPYRELLWVAGGALLAALALLVIKLPGQEGSIELLGLPIAIGRGVTVAFIALPMAAWAAVLLLRPGLPDSKRAVLFLIGTGLIITLVVETTVLRGDIGRQNTVFKLYLQVWTMFAVCGGAALGWLLKDQEKWSPNWRLAWQIGLASLVGLASLFTLLGTTAKVKDRMSAAAPYTLDGMAYMQYATYDESGYLMDLSQDYRAIRWMQENVAGSPVIVEANSGNLYRWYTRFTANTGLPNVVGWEWHQQQQRALTPGEWVSRRLREIGVFYNTTEIQVARQFLEKYNVRYIIVGQLEKATYPGPGLEKFEAYNGQFWQAVYRDQETVIYEVLEP